MDDRGLAVVLAVDQDFGSCSASGPGCIAASAGEAGRGERTSCWRRLRVQAGQCGFLDFGGHCHFDAHCSINLKSPQASESQQILSCCSAVFGSVECIFVLLSITQCTPWRSHSKTEVAAPWSQWANAFALLLCNLDVLRAGRQRL